MTIAEFIIPAFGAISGAAVSYFALDKRQAVTEARLTEQIRALEKADAAMKAEHDRSAADQGTRIGDLETVTDALVKWRARVEGAEEKEREMSGVVRNR